MWLLLVVVALLLFIVYNVYRQRETIPPENSIPTLPGRWPILQHLPFFKNTIKDQHLKYFPTFTDQYGKIWQFYLPRELPGIQKPYAIVFTCDPEVLKYTLSTGFKEGLFQKGETSLRQIREFIGSGIFGSNGQRWQDLRTFSSNLFHVEGLRAYVEIFHDNTIKLFNKLDQLDKSNGIDVQEYFMKYTLDSFSEIGFGVKLDSISSDTNDFATSFDSIQIHILKRGYSGRLWILKEFLSKPAEFYKHLEYMDNFVGQIITVRKQEPKEILKDRSDLLSQMLLENENASHEDLRDFVMNFLLAGRDTTAVLLTWCIYLLSSHPEVVNKMLNEFAEHIPENEVPTFANTKSLVYTKQVLQETLRLYPPVPIDGYTATKDCILPGGYKVLKDTQVRYCAWDLHRRPEFWGSNSAEFVPERFENVPAPFTWIPFHAGQRECLGKEMAYLEAKIMLVNFLRRYSFSLVPEHKVETKIGIILTAKNGVRVHLTPRTKN